MWKPTPPPHWRFKKKEYARDASIASFIYQLGESQILRERSKEVPITEITSNEFRQKVAYLKRCFRSFRKRTGKGVGIAAVQVGIPERFAIIWIPKVQEEMLVLINPEVTKRSEEFYSYPEMCMSASLIISPVVRPSWVEFTYYDEEANKQTWKRKADDKDGLKMNRVVQHEIDHLDGIIAIDHVQTKDIVLHSDPKFYKRKDLFKKI